jgi:anti-sigma factor RsiW
MSCGFEDELTAWVDGALPGPRAAEVAHHVEGCAGCAATVRLLRSTTGALAALAAAPAPAPSPGLRRAVLAAVEAPTLRERLTGWRASLGSPRVWGPGLAVAAGAAVLAVAALRPQAPGLEGDPQALELAMALETAGAADVAEDLEVAGLESPEDLELVVELHAMEVR